MKPIERIKKMIANKKEWRAYADRVKKLPKDYQVVYKEVEKYLFNFASGDGLDTVAGIYQLIDFLEEGAQNQIPVLDYVGQDVGEFAENYRKSLATQSWADDWQKKVQKNVAKKLDLKEGEKDDTNH